MISSATEPNAKTEARAKNEETTGLGRTQRVASFVQERQTLGNRTSPFNCQPIITQPVNQRYQKFILNANRSRDGQAESSKNQKGLPKEKEAQNLADDSVLDNLNKERFQKKTISKKRGPYRKYSANLRREAIKLCQELTNPTKAAAILDIPIKNLRRWIVTGPQRKVGGSLTRRQTIARPRHGGGTD